MDFIVNRTVYIVHPIDSTKRLGIWNTTEGWNDTKCPTSSLSACESTSDESPDVKLEWLNFNKNDSNWYAEGFNDYSCSHDLYTWILYRVEEDKVLLYNKCSDLYIYVNDQGIIKMNSHIRLQDGIIHPNYKWTIAKKKGDDGNDLGITLQCNNQYLLESLSVGGIETSFKIVPRVEFIKNTSLYSRMELMT